MITFLSKEDFVHKISGKLTPAYFNEKDLMTDWIVEDLADNGDGVRDPEDERRYLAFINGVPVIMSYICNIIAIIPINKGEMNFDRIKSKMFRVLSESFMENDDLMVFYVSMDDIIEIYFYHPKED